MRKLLFNIFHSADYFLAADASGSTNTTNVDVQKAPRHFNLYVCLYIYY